MKFTLKLLFIFFTVMTFSSQMYAEIYQWTDKEGNLHFSDKKPEDINSNEIDESALNERINSVKTVKFELISYSPLKQNNNSAVVIYTTSRCGFCQKAKEYFAKHNIKYKEKNIELSEKYNKEFDKLGGKGVPLIFYKQYRMSGFSQQKFASMYQKANS